MGGCYVGGSLSNLRYIIPTTIGSSEGRGEGSALARRDNREHNCKVTFTLLLAHIYIYIYDHNSEKKFLLS